MDDYEKTNIQEWDLNYKGPPKRDQPQASTAASSSKAPADSSRVQSTQPGPANRIVPQQRRVSARNVGPQARLTTARERRPAPPTRSAWLVAEGVKRREQTRQEPQILIEFADNAAEAAWRRRETPAATILVPEELVWRDQQHEPIAKKYGTFVTSEGGSGVNGQVLFGIWGEASAVKHTRQEIHNWVNREAPSKPALGTNTFSKQRSLLPRQRHSEEKKWILEVRRQRFRQCPPMGTPFGAMGTFHWPMKDYLPNEVLGNSHEALDPIRMACPCYIIFNSDISGFQVLGEAANVKIALLRIRKACFQIAARQIAPVRRYMLHFGDAGGDVPSQVTLEPYERIKRFMIGAATTQAYMGHSPKSQGEVESAVLEQQMLETSKRDIRIVGRSIMLMIAKLHFYRGHLRLRIRLGTVLTTHYRKTTEDGSYTVEDFNTMLKQSQFAGEVTPELGKRYCEEHALQTLKSADYLLDPRSSMDHTLFDVKPIYTAVFTFADNAGDLRLEMSWHEEEDSSDSAKVELVELSRTWTRLDRKSTGPSSLLDMSLLNLDKGSAWQFDLLASQAVENKRLAPEFYNIANAIRIDATAARQQRTDKKFFRWNPYAPVKTMQQRTSYLFALKNSNYTLELARFQDRVFARGGDVETEVYEPRWSVEVYHSVWDTMLTRNEHVPIGEMVDWDDGVKTWFPEDDDLDDLGQVKGEHGFEQLVMKLGLVEKLVLGVKSGTFGGMEVG